MYFHMYYVCSAMCLCICVCFSFFLRQCLFFFFFKQKTAYEMRISDWSSDVCSSDLIAVRRHHRAQRQAAFAQAGVQYAAVLHPLVQQAERQGGDILPAWRDRKSTRLNSSH